MKPLLNIKTIPIKFDVTRTKATYKEVDAPVVQQRPSRPRVRQQAEAQPQQIQPQRRPQPQPQPQQVSQQQYSAQAVKASDGVDFTSAGKVQQAAQAHYDSIETAQSYVPQGSFDYQMDRETFDWNNNDMPQLEYVPSTVEYSVSQYAGVEIEYTGDPIYVPAKSNPNKQN